MAKNSDDTQSIDWRSIRESLNWDEAQQENLLLHQRASQYAAPLRDENASVADTQVVLAFQLGVEQYGVDVTLVRGVRSITKITPVPGAPRFYRGVVNLRGQIITVLDLRQFFGLSVSEHESLRELVIIQTSGLELALLASHVLGVKTINANDIQPVDHIRYARGVTADHTVILDIASLFGDEQLIIGGQED